MVTIHESVYSAPISHRRFVTTMTAIAFFEASKTAVFPGARRMATFALALWLVSGCASVPAGQGNAFLPLVRDLAERVRIVDQVALSKWDSGRPVQDPQREAQVIEKAVAAAPAYGLGAQDVQAVFEDQIEASKAVQSALLAAWKRQGRAPAWPRQSLSDDIRPRLDTLQIAIMADLQRLGALRQAADCRIRVARVARQAARLAAFDRVHRAALDRAVARVCIGD